MSGGEHKGEGIEFTPTWVVAAVCAVIVAISLAVERVLHYLHKVLEKKQKPLLDALQKIKEELMILGFISLLLTVFQGTISKICVSQLVLKHMLPCQHNNTKRTGKFRKLSAFPIVDIPRRFLAEQTGYCSHKNKVPLFPLEAMHHLHIFIFVLAISHVTFCALTVVLGSATVRKWKIWEDSITNEDLDHSQCTIARLFAKLATGMLFSSNSMNQLIASQTQSLTFISTWYARYMMISSMLLVLRWNTYFWIAFIPLIHVMDQLAQEIAEKHLVAMEAELVVKPSDEHFWFKNPQIVLVLIHFIFFPKCFRDCVLLLDIPRLIIGVFIQVFYSYRIMPLCAIAGQMGSNFKKVIFEENVQAGLIRWPLKAKRNRELKTTINGESSSKSQTGSGPGHIAMAEQNNEISPDTN